MHEVGLMHEALTIAWKHAEESGGTRIHSLRVRLGPLSGVDKDALRFAFEVITSDTAAAGATLNVEETPIRCWCLRCEREFEPAEYICRCPDCGELSDDVRQGREFEVIAVEIS